MELIYARWKCGLGISSHSLKWQGKRLDTNHKMSLAWVWSWYVSFYLTWLKEMSVWTGWRLEKSMPSYHGNFIMADGRERDEWYIKSLRVRPEFYKVYDLKNHFSPQSSEVKLTGLTSVTWPVNIIFILIVRIVFLIQFFIYIIFLFFSCESKCF